MGIKSLKQTVSETKATLSRAANIVTGQRSLSTIQKASISLYGAGYANVYLGNSQFNGLYIKYRDYYNNAPKKFRQLTEEASKLFVKKFRDRFLSGTKTDSVNINTGRLYNSLKASRTTNYSQNDKYNTYTCSVYFDRTIAKQSIYQVGKYGSIISIRPRPGKFLAIPINQKIAKQFPLNEGESLYKYGSSLEIKAVKGKKKRLCLVFKGTNKIAFILTKQTVSRKIVVDLEHGNNVLGSKLGIDILKNFKLEDINKLIEIKTDFKTGAAYPVIKNKYEDRFSEIETEYIKKLYITNEYLKTNKLSALNFGITKKAFSKSNFNAFQKQHKINLSKKSKAVRAQMGIKDKKKTAITPSQKKASKKTPVANKIIKKTKVKKTGELTTKIKYLKNKSDEHVFVKNNVLSKGEISSLRKESYLKAKKIGGLSFKLLIKRARYTEEEIKSYEKD